MADKVPSAVEGYDRIKSSLVDGSAMDKFKQMIKIQGVSEEVATKLCRKSKNFYEVLPLSPHKTELKVAITGLLSSIDSLCCAEVTSALGAGRARPGDAVAHDVGMVLNFRIGELVKAGDIWVTVYHKNQKMEAELEERLVKAIVVDASVGSARSIQSRVIHIVR